MKLSIIIPVYNVEAYIEECLCSVIEQTHPNGLECILVDDCGTDSSISIARRIISEYQGPICFSVLHHKKNCGLSAARNTGLRAAQGDYVFFLDSDDKLSANCVETLLSPVRDNNYDMVIGDFEVIEGDDVFLHTKGQEGETLGRNAIAKLKCRNQWYPMAWGKLYRREFLEQGRLSFCEGVLNEDELFSAEIACLAESMYCLPESKSYMYRVRRGSIMTDSQYELRRVSCEKILAHMYAFLQEHKLDTDPVSNDLLYYLFNYANELSLKYSEKEYNKQYGRYRKIVCPVYAQRLRAANRPRALIRDAHYLLPECLGKYLYRFLSLRNCA